MCVAARGRVRCHRRVMVRLDAARQGITRVLACVQQQVRLHRAAAVRRERQ